MSNPAVPTIVESGDSILVTSSHYSWEMNRRTEEFELRDAHNRMVASGQLSPAIAVEIVATGEEVQSLGSMQRVEVDGATVRLRFEGLNGDGVALVEYIFFDDHFELSPVKYSSVTASSVNSLLWFAQVTEYGVVPAFHAELYLHLGSTESSAVGPVIPSKIQLSMTASMGRGGTDDVGIAQGQWALPQYFWGAAGLKHWGVDRSGLTQTNSDYVVGGLTEIPTGDLYVQYFGGSASPLLRVFGAKWDTHNTQYGVVSLGSSMVWAFGGTHRDAIAAYFRVLVQRGIVSPRADSPRKEEVATMSQYNTWGAQLASGRTYANFSQESLESIYGDVTGSGMNPQMFVIDDRWEREYGLLEHDPVRFPRFEAFLERVRSDGRAIGMWAAFVRCQDPASLGLTMDDVIREPDGSPFTRSMWADSYYMFDVSRPRVREVLRSRAMAFMSRYRPDLVKFDFGYELPSMKRAAPADRSWGGEILLLKSLELVVSAMREVNPDVVVMYYNLSPLLAGWVDQHSTDDMYLNAGEYGAEANRRIFFSSLLCELGIPTYGSGGYDWLDVRDVWFDTVAVGPLGSMNSFTGDQSDSQPSEADFARYRGLSRLTRRTTAPARIVPLDARTHFGSLTARSTSWARWEGTDLTMLALWLPSSGAPEATFPDTVCSTAQVVVASLTSRGIVASDHLGVVPCGSGTVRIRTEHAGSISAVAHSSTGGHDLPVTRSDDWIEVELSTFVGSTPVEWVELKFAND